MMREWLLISSLWWAGCGPSFDPISYLNKLRVLAIKAEPPELRPGETAQLEAVLGSTGLDGGAVDLEWAYCLRAHAPGGSGTNDDCVKNETADYLTPLGSGAHTMVTMPNVMP